MPARREKERDPLRDVGANLGIERLQILARQGAHEQGQEDQFDKILSRRRAVIGVELRRCPWLFGVRHFA